MSSNPMIQKDFATETVLEGHPMTVAGAINKTAILTAIVVGVAYYTWTICAGGFSDKVNMLLYGGAIAGFILALIASFKPQTSPITAPAYAVCEGFVVGAISYAYGSMVDGIVYNALAITFLALFAMLLLYRTGAIDSNPIFQKVVWVSTIAVAIFYFAGFIGALFGHPMTIFNGGMLGIGVSLLICVIASLNFILDFRFIEQGEKSMLPSYFEWYGAFALLVTLVWLYLEVLRLLAQLNRRD